MIRARDRADQSNVVMLLSHFDESFARPSIDSERETVDEIAKSSLIRIFEKFRDISLYPNDRGERLVVSAERVWAMTRDGKRLIFFQCFIAFS